MQETPYFIGIDLGTTNSSLAYIYRRGRHRLAVKDFAIPQLVKQNSIEPRLRLPSFLYLAGAHELAPGSIALPWDQERNFAIGEFARVQGQKVANRLVHSAKSWLCHGGQNRREAILPWGSEGVEKISPVEASARYLTFLRETWNHFHAKSPEEYLERQAIVLTVPASFDEVARELTLEAAHQAGFTNATLLEEPMAAFYHWIYSYHKKWPKRVKDDMLALVCDIGGGTTDFSLIEIHRDGDDLKFERIAVGEHLLLGGDNIDLALALQSEKMQAKKKLDPVQFAHLVARCAQAKEDIWGEQGGDSYEFAVAGRGSALIGGSLKFCVTREFIEEVVLEGFFPLLPWAESAKKTIRVGFKEWGLPYESEPAITHHLRRFLQHHLPARQKPDLLLFNGGTLTPKLVQQRLVDQLSQWFSDEGKTWKPIALNHKSLDLAVSRGACYFHLVRQGQGIRIGGGIPRAYFLRTDSEEKKAKAICLLPFGSRQGESFVIDQHPLEAIARQMVSFPLYTSSVRKDDALGDIVELDESEMTPMAPLAAVLKVSKKAKKNRIPVKLQVDVNEIGTLDLWLVARDSERSWRLQFQLHAHKKDKVAVSDEAKAFPREKIEKILASTFADKVAPQHDPQTLTRTLETALAAKKTSWDLTANRRLADLLLKLSQQRGLSQAHEERWLNLVGFCLRPGIGFPKDKRRIQQLWQSLNDKVLHNRHIPSWLEWWVLWRRVAAGLDAQHQLKLFRYMASHLLPDSDKWSVVKPLHSYVKAAEVAEMWRAAASLEELPTILRYQLGQQLFARFRTDSPKEYQYWSLARLGTRSPFSGQSIISPEQVSPWIECLLEMPGENFHRLSALAYMARKTGDRVVDIDDHLRQRVLRELGQYTTSKRVASLYTMVEEVLELSNEMQQQYLGDALPVGLVLRGKGESSGTI